MTADQSVHDGAEPFPRLGAVVLTGGTGSRMGGADKAGLDVGGLTLLERALAAVSQADETVVVGDEVATSRPVVWTRESPPGGGPAAGLLAGIDAFTEPPDLVATLAVDMPRVTAATIARLTWSVKDAICDGALLVDRDGNAQTLCAVYRHNALRLARPRDRAQEHGLSVRALVGDLLLLKVSASGWEAQDVDTWDDLRQVRDRLPEDGGPAAPGEAIRGR